MHNDKKSGIESQVFDCWLMCRVAKWNVDLCHRLLIIGNLDVLMLRGQFSFGFFFTCDSRTFSHMSSRPAFRFFLIMPVIM